MASISPQANPIRKPYPIFQSDEMTDNLKVSEGSKLCINTSKTCFGVGKKISLSICSAAKCHIIIHNIMDDTYRLKRIKFVYLLLLIFKIEHSFL